MPLAVIDLLERDSGKRWEDLCRTASGLAAIAGLLAGDGAPGMRVDELVAAPDNRPTEYQDGIPCVGGRTADQFVVMFGKPPWCWPPDVTLRQSLRHLLVLAESIDEME